MKSINGKTVTGKRFLLSLLFVPFSLLILLSCNPCRYVAHHPECFAPDTIRETITSTMHDSITWIQFDTTLFDAIFACDSLNNVLMKQVDEYKTKGVKTKVVFRDNRLQLSMFTDSIAILNKIIREHKTHSEYIKNPVNDELKRQNEKLENRMHNRRWLLWYFVVSIAALIAYLFLKFI